MTRLLVNLFGLCAVCVLTSVAAAQTLDSRDLTQNVFVRELQRSIGTATNPSRDQSLFALRSMRDPTLRPLFGQLAASRDPLLRRHGILGLAMLEDPARINVLMIANLASPAERTDVLLAAIDESLIGPGQIDDMLAWPGLDERVEVRLRARRATEGLSPDLTRLEELAKSAEPNTATLALCLLASAGEDTALPELQQRLEQLTPLERLMLIERLCSTFKQDLHQGAAGVVSWLVQTTPEDDRTVELISTLLALSPEEGCALFNSLYERASSLGARLRLAMAALAQSSELAPECFEVLLSDPEDSILNQIGRIGKSISSGADPSTPISELLSDRYGPAARWIVNWAAAQDGPRGESILVQAVQAWRDRDQYAPIDPAVVLAARHLADRKSPQLTFLLRSASDAGDGQLCAALLLGMSQSVETPLDASISNWSWPNDESAAMAALIEASSLPDPADEELVSRLRRIASGWGSLPAPLRTKTAWLAIRMCDIEREALSVVLVSLE